MNHYDTLGVLKTATQAEIKKAYHKLALKFHPDKHAGQSDEAQKKATKMFQEIGKANDVLKDETTRAVYDLMLCYGSGGSSSYRGKSKSHRQTRHHHNGKKQTRQRHYDETQNLASAQACLAQLLRSNGGSMGGNVLPKRYKEMYGFDLYYFGYKNLTELMKTVSGVEVHPNQTGKGYNSFTLSESVSENKIHNCIRHVLRQQPEYKISGSGFVHQWKKVYPNAPSFSFYWKNYGYSSQKSFICSVRGVKIIPGTPEYYLLRC